MPARKPKPPSAAALRGILRALQLADDNQRGGRPRVLSVEESMDIRAARSWAIATRTCFPSFKDGRFP